MFKSGEYKNVNIYKESQWNNNEYLVRQNIAIDFEKIRENHFEYKT